MKRACRLIGVALLALATNWSMPAAAAAAATAAESFPWGPEARCNLNRANPAGLHPGAFSALQRVAVTHRITQGIDNNLSDRGNVHYADLTIGGIGYTGAVDISVRCLSEAQIRTLLARLADLGFAAWYRKDGQDDWKGPPHIHAVWAGSPLKPVLRRQVESWLNNGNGLGSGREYRFWQPSVQMKETVRALYQSSN
jgi:hypothetical protein